MTADFRALCVELTDCLEKADWPLRHRYVFRQWIDIARAALAGEPAALLPLADTHYEWELEDAKGEWQAGGSSNSQSDVEREGMRYLQTYAQDGPHKLIIRQHTTQTINEITNG